MSEQKLLELMHIIVKQSADAQIKEPVYLQLPTIFFRDD